MRLSPGVRGALCLSLSLLPASADPDRPIAALAPVEIVTREETAPPPPES